MVKQPFRGTRGLVIGLNYHQFHTLCMLTVIAVIKLQICVVWLEPWLLPYMSAVKSAYQKINFVISQPKHLFKLMDWKIFTILPSKFCLSKPMDKYRFL